MDNEQRPDGLPSEEDDRWKTSSSNSIISEREAIHPSGATAFGSETAACTELQPWTEVASYYPDVQFFMNVDAADGLGLSIQPPTNPGNHNRFLFELEEPELNSNPVRLSELHHDASHHVVFDIPGRFILPFFLQTKNEPWKNTTFRICSSLEGGISGYAVTDQAGALQWNIDPSIVTNNISSTVNLFKETKEFILAGDRNRFCINVGKPPGPGNLVIFNSLTQTVEFLPSLIYRRHPVLMHVKVNDNGDDHFKILIAGSTGITGSVDLSLKTEVYDSEKGRWEICPDLPCLSYGLTEFQTGACYKDSESREFVCCIADIDTEGTKGVLMFDFQKKQWVTQGSIKRQIPLVISRGVVSNISHIANTQIVSCGGLIFVVSEQVCAGDQKYSCIQKLNPDNFGSDCSMWKDILRRKITTVHELIYPSSQLVLYPDFPCVPLSATGVESGGSVFVFSEQESSGEDHNFICIHILKQDASSGGGVWEEIERFEKKRPRSANWTSTEIALFLKMKEEALAMKPVGKEHWDFISQGLEQNGFNRGPKACEDQWGTLLKRHKQFQNDLTANSIHPSETSGRANYSNCQELRNKTLQLQKFSLECYETVDRIQIMKSRMSRCGAGNQKYHDQPSSSSVLNDSTITSADSSGLAQAARSTPNSGAPLTEGLENSVGELTTDLGRPGMADLTSAVSDLCNRLRVPNSTNEEMARVNDEVLKIFQRNLELETKRMDLEILRETNRARDYEDRRPRRQRKKKT